MDTEQTTQHFIRRASTAGLTDIAAMPEAILEERSKQVGKAIAYALKTSLNSASSGMFRVCEHVQKRVPQVVDDKKEFSRLEDRAHACYLNMKDARATIQSMSNMDTFNQIEMWLNQAIQVSKKT